MSLEVLEHEIPWARNGECGLGTRTQKIKEAMLEVRWSREKGRGPGTVKDRFMGEKWSFSGNKNAEIEDYRAL